MENKITEKNKNNISLPKAILAILVLVGAGFMSYANTSLSKDNLDKPSFGKTAAVPQAQTLLIHFGDLGPKLVSSGAIDKEKFLGIYNGNEMMMREAQKLLDGTDNGDFIVTENNAPVVLNFLWALGLGNKNQILEKGPMMDQRYGGAGNFASTGGWTLARGNAMDHYSMHSFIPLTSEEQLLVERVSKNIYRPCCDNSTYFPDCNHGIAMLGLLELLAVQGAGEEEMYKIALTINTYWFPGTYETITQYAKEKRLNLSPKEMLGSDYSSSSGFRNISSQVTQFGQQQGGGGCGVGGTPQAAPQRQQSGCGAGGVPQAAPQQRQQNGCGVN